MSSAVLESEDECSEWEKLRRGGWKDGLFETISNIASTDDLMWTNLVLVSSCVSCWSLVLFTGLIFPPHLCPIRLISPALHLHCTSFTGLSSSSSTSLLLVFFCSFPSPVSLHLHSSPSWGLFVCQLVLLARSLSGHTHPLCPCIWLLCDCRLGQLSWLSAAPLTGFDGPEESTSFSTFRLFSLTCIITKKRLHFQTPGPQTFL